MSLGSRAGGVGSGVELLLCSEIRPLSSFLGPMFVCGDLGGYKRILRGAPRVLRSPDRRVMCVSLSRVPVIEHGSRVMAPKKVEPKRQCARTRWRVAFPDNTQPSCREEAMH